MTSKDTGKGMTNYFRSRGVSLPLWGLRGGALMLTAPLLGFLITSPFDIPWGSRLGATCVATFPIAIAYLYFYRMFGPKLGRVLFLRRFHYEKPPQFPLSRIFASLGFFGFETVTLADAIISKDRESLLPIAGLVAGVINLLLLYFCFVATVLLSIALAGTRLGETIGQGARPVFFVIVIAVGFCSSFIIARILLGKRRALMDGLMQWLMETIVRWIVRVIPGGVIDARDWDHRMISSLGKGLLRQPWQIGTVVLRSSDENWEALIRRLIETSMVVCIDISNPSRHIVAETHMLAGLKHGEHIVWMRAAGSALSFLQQGGEDFSVFGARFKGPFVEFVYPGDDSSLLYQKGRLHENNYDICMKAESLVSLFPLD